MACWADFDHFEHSRARHGDDEPGQRSRDGLWLYRTFPYQPRLNLRRRRRFGNNLPMPIHILYRGNQSQTE
jgi:hypothetical protein